MPGRRRFGQWLIRTIYLHVRMPRRRPKSPHWRGEPRRSARSTHTGSAISGRRSRSTSRPTATASRRSTRARSRAWSGSSRTASTPSSASRGCGAVPARGAELRRAAAAGDAGLRRAPPPAGRPAHLRRGLRRHGGIDAVREVADRNMDLVAEALYDRLEHQSAGSRRPRTRTSSWRRSSSTTCWPRA